MIIRNLTGSTRQVIVAMAVVGASFLYAQSAMATTRAADALSVTVKYGDLDLSTEVGIHRLYRRIVAAAEQVCPGDSALDLQSILAARACRVDAIARAVRVVNNPQLAALYEQSSQHG